jgi:hypothetical protein
MEHRSETLTEFDGNDKCQNPPFPEPLSQRPRRSIPVFPQIRKTTDYHNGYTTVDDFGTDGDDTLHSKPPYYPQPNFFQASVSLPSDGTHPESVDLIFLDITQKYILPALSLVGANYTKEQISYYMPKNFTSNYYLREYAKLKWQAGMPYCPVGSD